MEEDSGVAERVFSMLEFLNSKQNPKSSLSVILNITITRMYIIILLCVIVKILFEYCLNIGG